MTNPDARHPSTEHVMQFFAYAHLPAHLQEISVEFYELACKMLQRLPDGPELTAGLRRLLEAKDCFVRQAVLKKQNEEVRNG